MTLENQQWISAVVDAAKKSGHIWPVMAASEAALESNYGKSKLAKQAKNLFGMKYHMHREDLGKLSLPTKEFINGEWLQAYADWCAYDTLAECFADRMATLSRLAPKYPHYQAALDATDAHTYVTEVSKTWSTDPDRAAKVIEIYTVFSGAALPPDLQPSPDTLAG